jgi:hypothetical protein
MNHTQKPKFILIGESITSPVSNTHRKEILVEIYVDENGYVQNAGFEHRPIGALEQGPIDGPKAIVLHRTDSTTAANSIQSFKSGVGTHFIVDKDGTVTQTASLLKHTYHVGKIKSRCYDSGTCPADETKEIRGWGWDPEKIHNHEKAKSYPTRYPMNKDSVGIEVVAKYNSGAWDAATQEQLESVSLIVKILKDTYCIGEDDIYEHDKISYKTQGEGAGLYSGGVQPSLPSCAE